VDIEDLMRSPTQLGKLSILPQVTGIMDTETITAEGFVNLFKWKNWCSRHRDSHNREWKLTVVTAEKSW
jgi:hypothetical protein